MGRGSPDRGAPALRQVLYNSIPLNKRRYKKTILQRYVCANAVIHKSNSSQFKENWTPVKAGVGLISTIFSAMTYNIEG
jgi:hypothetical protein